MTFLPFDSSLSAPPLNFNSVSLYVCVCVLGPVDTDLTPRHMNQRREESALIHNGAVHPNGKITSRLKVRLL